MRRVDPSAVARATRPRSLSQVSHSLVFTMPCGEISNCTTRLLRATTSVPRRHARPLTCSLNSISPTTRPRASSHRMTLLGGYCGLRPPPTRNIRLVECKGRILLMVPVRFLLRISFKGFVLYTAKPCGVDVANILQSASNRASTILVGAVEVMEARPRCIWVLRGI